MTITLPAGTNVYTWGSAFFYRQVDGDTVKPWFDVKVEYTQDLVLESGLDYLDIGATSYGPLQITAVVLDVSYRTTLLNAVGETHVLSNTKGYSQDATLISADPLDTKEGDRWLVTLTFIRRPTGSA